MQNAPIRGIILYSSAAKLLPTVKYLLQVLKLAPLGKDCFLSKLLWLLPKFLMCSGLFPGWLWIMGSGDHWTLLTLQGKFSYQFFIHVLCNFCKNHIYLECRFSPLISICIFCSGGG